MQFDQGNTPQYLFCLSCLEPLLDWRGWHWAKIGPVWVYHHYHDGAWQLQHYTCAGCGSDLYMQGYLANEAHHPKATKRDIRRYNKLLKDAILNATIEAEQS